MRYSGLEDMVCGGCEDAYVVGPVGRLIVNERRLNQGMVMNLKDISTQKVEVQ